MGEYKSRNIGESSPVARFTGQELPMIKGLWMVGTKVGQRAGKEYPQTDSKGQPVLDEKGQPKFKKSLVFEFTLHDMDDRLPIQKKNGKIYENVNINIGDKVVVFGNSQLDDKLDQVPTGQKIRVTYNGKKLNENNGRWYNDYTVVDE